jgi:DeoR/GlpR family transcriptional regulator of sugar metabolism
MNKKQIRQKKIISLIEEKTKISVSDILSFLNIKMARKITKETKQAVIRMHKYVIKMISKPSFTIRVR